MKHSELVKLLKDSGDYVTDIEYGQCDDFIGFVYARNYKYDNDEFQIQFAIPIQSEEEL